MWLAVESSLSDVAPNVCGVWSGCCASAVAKGRKLCCKCGGAHNANESHVGRQQDDFSAAILTDGGGSSSKDAVAE